MDRPAGPRTRGRTRVLKPDKIAEVLRLLITGSRREVAKESGVSRPTVNLIANGKHRVGQRRPRAAKIVAVQNFETIRAWAERGVKAKLEAKRKKLAAERAS
jgi:transcriptional regulator with XRE-family HTH domain